MNLARARERLGLIDGLEVAAASPVYRTEPQDLKDQPWFANQVLRVLCGPQLGALSLLDALLSVEQELGRERGGDALRYGPRVIDLDLLLYGDEVLDTDRLCLPHPRMRERAFVLVPLGDLAADLALPTGGTVAQALAELTFRVEGDRIFQS